MGPKSWSISIVYGVLWRRVIVFKIPHLGTYYISVLRMDLNRDTFGNAIT